MTNLPWWIIIYIVFFVLILISNIYLQIKFKAKKIILIYEILSTCYLLFLILGYWIPEIMKVLSIYNVIPFAIILLVDFYFSLWGKPEDIGMKEKLDISKKEMEQAKAISLILASPAYIISILVLMNLI